MDTKHWCPTCKNFFKDFGLNNCKLVDWGMNPVVRTSPAIEWWKRNTDTNTRIYDDADNCPCWVHF